MGRYDALYEWEGAVATEEPPQSRYSALHAWADDQDMVERRIAEYDQITPRYEQYSSDVGKYAEEYGIDPNFLAASIAQETSYRPSAESSAGAAGIAQFIPSTAREMEPSLAGLSDEQVKAWLNEHPTESLRMSAKYKRQLLDRYGGDEQKAIAAYNAGPGKVDTAVEQATSLGGNWLQYMPEETRKHVPIIMGLKERFRGRNASSTDLPPNLPPQQPTPTTRQVQEPTAPTTQPESVLGKGASEGLTEYSQQGVMLRALRRMAEARGMSKEEAAEKYADENLLTSRDFLEARTEAPTASEGVLPQVGDATPASSTEVAMGEPTDTSVMLPGMEGGAPPTPETKPKRSFVKKVKEAFRRGDTQAVIDMMAYEARHGKRSWEEVERITKEFEKKNAADPVEAGNWLGNAVLGLSQMLPALGRGVAEGQAGGLGGAAGGAGAAAIAGQLGPQAAAPEEIVTVPAAAAVGYNVGAAVGSANYWRKLAAGGMYSTLRQKNIPHKTAATISDVASVPYALVELLQVKKAIPGADKALKNILSKGVTRALAFVTGKYAMEVGEEVAEEGVQGAIEQSATEAAQYLEGQASVGDIPESGKRVALRAAQAMKESVGPMTLMLLPKGARRTLGLRQLSAQADTEVEGLAQKIEDDGFRVVDEETGVVSEGSGLARSEAEMLEMQQKQRAAEPTTPQAERRETIEAGVASGDPVRAVRLKYGDTPPTKAQVVEDFGVSREQARNLVANAYQEGYSAQTLRGDQEGAAQEGVLGAEGQGVGGQDIQLDQEAGGEAGGITLPQQEEVVAEQRPTTTVATASTLRKVAQVLQKKGTPAADATRLAAQEIEAMTPDQVNIVNAIIDDAGTDPLTGLRNTKWGMDNEYLRPSEEGTGFEFAATPNGIVMVDIDNFKWGVNEPYGHGTGNKVLSKFGYLLTKNLRGKADVIRYGGEEIAVLPLTDVAREDILKSIEATRGELVTKSFEGREGMLKGVTFSAGFGQDFETADDQLNLAKLSGRGQTRVEGELYGTQLQPTRSHEPGRSAGDMAGEPAGGEPAGESATPAAQTGAETGTEPVTPPAPPVSKPETLTQETPTQETATEPAQTPVEAPESTTATEAPTVAPPPRSKQRGRPAPDQDLFGDLSEITQSVDEVIDEQLVEAQAGFLKLPRGKTAVEGEATVTSEEEVASAIPDGVNQAARDRMKAARGKTRENLIVRTRRAANRLKRGLTRHDPNLDPVEDAAPAEIFRQYEDSRHKVQLIKNGILRGITAPLQGNEVELFEANAILPDMLRTVENDPDLFSDRDELWFGYQSAEEIQADYDKYAAAAAKNKRVSEALTKRRKLLGSMTKALVKAKLLAKAVLKDPRYYHRQVLEYMDVKHELGLTQLTKGKVTKKGYQKKRVKGSVKDFNTMWSEAEGEWVADALQQLEDIKMIEKVDAEVGVGKQVEKDYVSALEDLYKDLGGDLEEFYDGLAASKTPKPAWKYALRNAINGLDETALTKNNLTNYNRFIPDGYTEIPVEEMKIYSERTIPSHLMDDLLQGKMQLTEDMLKEVHALGGRGKTIIVPTNVADTLRNLVKAQSKNIFAQASRNIMHGWKRIKLFSPTRFPIYTVNNWTGDADPVFATYPGIFKEYRKAMRELWGIRQGKGVSRELIDLVGKGVIGSGYASQEIPDITKDEFFGSMLGKKGVVENLIKSPVKSYFDFVQNLNGVREDTMRLAAYRWVLQQMKTGKKGMYGASRRESLQALESAKTLTVEDRAAKLSRELIGDYGARTEFGDFMREHVAPFWSFQEINLQRYYNILRNAPFEGVAPGERIAKMMPVAIGKGAGKLGLRAAQAAIFLGMVEIWNRLAANAFFPGVYDEMDEDTRQMRVILWRDDEGNIYTLRAQGALSDVLAWAGMENTSGAMEDLIKGKKSFGEFGKEAANEAINKAFGMIGPQYKWLGEAITKKSFYPDLFKPRNIRNTSEYIAKQFEVHPIMRWIEAIPGRGLTDELMNLIVYKQSAGEGAYFKTLNIVDKFKKETSQSQFGGASPNPRSNSLYYMKKAIRYKDKRAAKKWFREYVKLSTEAERNKISESIDRSLRAAHPLNNVKRKHQRVFNAWLSEEDKKTVARGIKWYNEIYRTKVGE